MYKDRAFLLCEMCNENYRINISASIIFKTLLILFWFSNSVKIGFAFMRSLLALAAKTLFDSSAAILHLGFFIDFLLIYRIKVIRKIFCV